MRKQINPATVMAVMALIFAATGGAYAATGGGQGSQVTANAAKKKKSKSIRGPAGPRGATGAPGPAGAQGPAGPAGPAGLKGDTGSAGTNGSNGESVMIASAGSECKEGGTTFSNSSGSGSVCNGEKGRNGSPGTAGTNGESVISKEFVGSAGPACKEGGSEFESEPAKGKVKTYACNGKEGKEGSPWTAGGTLPSGKTETGTWSVSQYNIAAPSATPIEAPISFTLPLTKGSGEEEGPGGTESVYYFTETQTKNKEFGTSGCSFELANAESRPMAPAGVLCVFTAHETNKEVKFQNVDASNSGLLPPAYGTAGATLEWQVNVATSTDAEVRDRGVWAVTAP